MSYKPDYRYAVKKVNGALRSETKFTSLHEAVRFAAYLFKQGEKEVILAKVST